MGNPLLDDPRIDPRIKRFFADLESARLPNVASRDAILTAPGSVESRSDDGSRTLAAVLASADYSSISPADDVDVEVRRITASPDGNAVNLMVVKPRDISAPSCVVYIHGGGMMMMSCFDGNYSAWARMIARGGVTVVMIDFRNALSPSSVPEVAPYPAGLNDCISAWHHIRDHAADWGIDPARMILAGDSGGANLALATALSLRRAGELQSPRALYLTCPYLAGSWPGEPGSSALENAGIVMDLRSNFAAMAYGIEAFEAGDMLAWPGFATEQDLAGLPPTIINVNECDPLRDDGVSLYRKLLGAGVTVRCRQLMGTVHGTEVFVACCPDLSADIAHDIARQCLG